MSQAMGGGAPPVLNQGKSFNFNLAGLAIKDNFSHLIDRENYEKHAYSSGGRVLKGCHRSIDGYRNWPQELDVHGF